MLRLLPESELRTKWVFPKEEFESAELSIIDANGGYIIHGASFKNTSFFEFYKSYNKISSSAANELFTKITTETGSFTMFNSLGEECILSHTPFGATGGWTLVSMMPMKYLRNAPFDEVYSPFANMPEERTFSPEVIGITDDLARQIRVAAYKVGRGDLTIDEAVAQYGSF